jgi:transcriptional regulatory protein RtcR
VLNVGRLVLLYERKIADRAAKLAREIESLHVEVRLHELAFENAFEFTGVYDALHEFAGQFRFERDVNYYAHLTTGTHVVQICLFLLVQSRQLPAKLVTMVPPPKRRGVGTHQLHDPASWEFLSVRAASRTQPAKGIEILKRQIETRDPRLLEIYADLERAAASSDGAILLEGESGVGKTELAAQIHRVKKENRRLTGAFVAVNCASLRGDLAESALFGHARGAFTGAVDRHRGYLVEADRGTLLLDEIADLPLDSQAMLLTAIETGTFRPLRAEKDETSTFSLIAGTNASLEERVRAGTFREDLLNRLTTWRFRLPPLRERHADIEENLEYEFRRCGQPKISLAARERYLAFALSQEAKWRGNFRDLRNSVDRMVSISKGDIRIEHVEHEIEKLCASWAAALAPSRIPEGGQDLDEFDRIQLAAVVETISGAANLAEAGRRLFTQSRVKNESDRVRKYLLRFDLELRNGRVLRRHRAGGTP